MNTPDDKFIHITSDVLTLGREEFILWFDAQKENLTEEESSFCKHMIRIERKVMDEVYTTEESYSDDHSKFARSMFFMGFVAAYYHVIDKHSIIPVTSET